MFRSRKLIKLEPKRPLTRVGSEGFRTQGLPSKTLANGQPKIALWTVITPLIHMLIHYEGILSAYLSIRSLNPKSTSL